MTLAQANIGQDYTVASLATDDEDLEDFLFTLGCYAGEIINVISSVGENFTVAIRDGRYNIDRNLAACISVK